MDKIAKILTELDVDFFTNGYQVWLLSGKQIRVTNSYVYFSYPNSNAESCLKLSNPMLKSWMRNYLGGAMQCKN